ncbi:MAG: tripartite tricarboxylate transporter TctB family protein [Burkholderiaceae bacterium]
MSISITRLVAAAMLLIGIVAAWSSSTLEIWSFMGPGAGLFPLLVSGACIVLAAIVLCTPAGATGKTAASDHTEVPSDDAGVATEHAGVRSGEDAARAGAAAEPDADADDGPLAAAERRTYAAYCAALPLIAAGVTWLGLFVTCVLVALLVVWIGERRGLRSALTFGIATGLIGDIVFGWLLSVEIPIALPDQLILQLLR